MLVEISGMDDFNELVDYFRMFCDVLEHKSVSDFSEIYTFHIHFYVIGHSENLLYETATGSFIPISAEMCSRTL